MKILLIEDTKDLSNNIKKLLEMYDKTFLIKQAFSIQQADKFLNEQNFEFILLDLMLPDGNGFDFCKKFKENNNLPVIIMTAKWEDNDKILWLELWADDYIVKPFKVKELYLRIKSVEKRYYLPEKIRIKDVEIDFENKVVYKNWIEVHLKLKEFQILEYIHEMETASRSNIVEEIWWDDLFSSDGKLDVYISNIRKKLWKYVIKTIKWYGYSIWN